MDWLRQRLVVLYEVSVNDWSVIIELVKCHQMCGLYGYILIIIFCTGQSGLVIVF